MLKKHQILEQAVEDYAETVHQLSKTSRALVADSHPERWVLHYKDDTRLRVLPWRSLTQNRNQQCLKIHGKLDL